MTRSVPYHHPRAHASELFSKTKAAQLCLCTKLIQRIHLGVVASSEHGAGKQVVLDLNMPHLDALTAFLPLAANREPSPEALAKLRSEGRNHPGHNHS